MAKIIKTAGWILGIALLVSGAALANPADKLSEAKQEIADDHAYSADALLQEIVKDELASSAQVQEALLLQSLIYYGDVFGAALVLPACSIGGQEPNDFTNELGQQLLLARRAFAISADKYLNETVIGAELARVQFTLPDFTTADVEQLQATISDPAAMSAMMGGYANDPSPAKGLLARANQFGFYLGSGALLGPTSGERKVTEIRSGLSRGAAYNHALLLDWLARVALDMNTLIKEPNGPDLIGLSKRANNRLLNLYGDDAGNQHVINARQRAGLYPQ